MLPVTTTTGWTRRHLTAAWHSRNLAEALVRMLADNPLPGNPYYDDAVQRADELLGEMEDDVEFHMTAAVAAGFGPEDFE